MSDIDTSQGSSDNDSLVTVKRSQIKVLEKQAAERKDAIARAERAERGLAFAEAGIPLNDKRFTWFIKGYDGDITAEAIRQAAIESQLLEDEGVSQPSPEQEQERQVHQRIDSATSAGQVVGEQNVDAALAAAYEKGGDMAVIDFLRSKGIPVAED